MGKCSKCSNAQASYYDPDDGPGRYCKQCARDVPNVVSRWQKDKKRKAEARGEGAGAGSGMGQDNKRALDAHRDTLLIECHGACSLPPVTLPCMPARP